MSILAAFITSESDGPETLLRTFQSSTETLVIRTCKQKQQRDDATRYKHPPLQGSVKLIAAILFRFGAEAVTLCNTV